MPQFEKQAKRPLGPPKEASAASHDVGGVDAASLPPVEPSVVARVAFFAFLTCLAAVGAVLAAILISERSAMRRADADLFGALCDHCASAIEDRIDVSRNGLSESQIDVIQGELALLADAKGVRQVALFVNDGQEVLSARSAEFDARMSAAGVERSLPVVSGPGRTLRDDHLVVARTFRPSRMSNDEFLLAVEADYPGLDRRMRDLIALAGRAVGLSALFLVFFVPLLAHWLLRAQIRVARAVDADWLPSTNDARGGGAELVSIVQRIERDAVALGTIEREHADLSASARSQLERLRSELNAQSKAVEEAHVVARSATEAKAAFVANTSHEIRTPLHAVLGSAGLLLETDLDAEQRSLAERASRASQTLLSLVDDVLDLARFDAREIKIETARFDAGRLLEDVAELGGPLAAAKGIELSSFVGPEVPGWLVGDTARIRQALMRLVDNAIKFTDKGEVSLELSWEAGEDGVPRAVFTVADTGLGIDDEKRAYLFRAFEQLDTSNTRRHGGVGLGLALVARIARAMGGEVRLESRRGAGSTFRLALPLPVDAEHARELTEGRVQVLRPLAGRRVLVLDDATRAAETMLRTLEHLGATVTAEPSTYAGFETILRGQFDVVLIDSLLPGRDAFLGALESNDQQGRIPLVLMTPAHADRLPDDARDEAVAAVIAKPLSRADLVRVIDHVTGEGEASAAKEEAAPNELLESAARSEVRILLVEDNHTNQQLVQYVLGKRGYQVDVASNGRRAIDAFAVGNYAVVLMDCQMPEMDGYEATRRIRALERERGTHTPVLAMTASVLESDRDRCISAGMDDLLAKPFQPTRMIEWLEGWLLRALYSEDASKPVRRRTTRSEAMREIEAEAAPVAPAAPQAAPAPAPFSAPTPTPTPAPTAPIPALDLAAHVAADAAIPSASTPVQGVTPPAALPAPRDEVQDQAERQALIAAALDVDVLGALMDDEEGRELASELIASFFEVAPERLSALAAAADSGDLALCATIAHAMVSTCGTVGAVRAARMLREIERFAGLGSHADVQRLVTASTGEVETATRALQMQLADASGS